MDGEIVTDRALAGVMLVCVVLIIGVLVYRGYKSPDVSAGAPGIVATPAGEARSTQVKARIQQCDRTSGDKTLARGTITNIGNADLHYVTLKVLWLNSAGLVIEASELYALNDEVLSPGETKSFSDVTGKATAVRCNVETVDWW